MLRKLFFFTGCFGSAVCGMVATEWWTEDFPVRSNHRYVLTETVRASDEVEIGIDVNRDKNCPMTIQRRITYSDGSPLPITQEVDKDFGPTGPDQYILRIPTSPNAPKGPTTIWSQGCARCNPLHYLHRLLEVCSPERIDRFEIGDYTISQTYPKNFLPKREQFIQPR